MAEIEKPKINHLLNRRVFFGFLITLLRPKLVPEGAYLHPMLLILSVFGGLALAGFMGVVYGPVIMIVFVTTIDLYRTFFLRIGTPEEGNNEVALSAK